MTRRTRSALACAVALVLAASACGTGESGDSPGDGGRRTLTGALAATFNPDPDQFFDLEGVMVTNSVYESLVVNPPGSTDVEGLLAESWDISADGLTYTFRLRPEATFADGTPIDAEAIRASFERRQAAAGTPSYLLAEVAGYDVPDASTFVVHLTTPVNNFLYRLASPWAPMAVNPAIIEEQAAAGDDFGASYLEAHSAGSGPYVISSVAPDQEIVLEKNEDYWGDEPYFDEVIFEVVSDPTAQRVQLEGGDLDLVQGVNPEAADAIEADGTLTVAQPPAFNMAFWQVNTQRPPFDRPEVLAALPRAVPFDELVEEVYGSWATAAHQTTTAGRMPEQYGLWEPEYDPAALSAAFDALPDDVKSIPVETAYPVFDNGVHRRLNDRLVEILEEAGFTASTREVTGPEYLGFVGNPDATPHVVGTTQPDDGVHPDNWYRLWMHSQAALNVGGAGLPEADALFDQANATPPGAEPPYDLYAQGGKLVTDAGHFIPIADAPVIWVTQPDIEGATTRLASPQALVIQDLRRAE